MLAALALSLLVHRCTSGLVAAALAASGSPAVAVLATAALCFLVLRRTGGLHPGAGILLAPGTPLCPVFLVHETLHDPSRAAMSIPADTTAARVAATTLPPRSEIMPDLGRERGALLPCERMLTVTMRTDSVRRIHM